MSSGSLSRPDIEATLTAAGYPLRNGDEAGCMVKREGSRWRVMWGGDSWSGREAKVAQIAQALREAGYKARLSNAGGYPTVTISA